MRFIHLTDPHLSSLAGHSFLGVKGKRRSGYLSWTQRRHTIHTRQTLDQLTDAIQAESPDQIILSGDLIQIGLEQEIQQVGKWLEALAPAEQILFVPGNHDVYAEDSWSSIRRHWDFILPPRPGNEADNSRSAYPLARDLGNIRLIGISSAYVTPIFSARGAIGKKQFKRLEQLIQQAHDLAYMPFLVIHHPPLPGMSIWRKALKEVDELKKLISKQKPALICCGHLHQNIEVIEGETRVFSTASASNRLNASYRVFDIEQIDKENAAWSIRMQRKTINPISGKIEVKKDKSWSFSR
jgi:3',5'-cyclic AMP phosphodiesterase CpdA